MEESSRLMSVRTSDEESQHSDSQPSRSSVKPYYVKLAFVSLALFAMIALVAVLLPGDPDIHHTVDSESLVSLSGETSVFTEVQCGQPRSFEWVSISSIDPISKKAANMALGLVQAGRKKCQGGAMPPLPYDENDFAKGSNRKNYMHVHHKFAQGCTGETFKLHFHHQDEGQGKAGHDTAQHGTGFVIEIFHDLKTDSWNVLTSLPPACEIRLGIPGMPEELSPTGMLAQEASAFAASELSLAMKKAGCMGLHDVLAVSQVKDIRVKVAVGLRIRLIIKFKLTKSGSIPIDKAAKLWVLERCDLPKTPGETSCKKQLVIPKANGPSVCEALQDPSQPEVQRLLFEDPQSKALGHFRADATDKYLAQKNYFFGERRLLSELPPMVDRHITTGNVPASYDPRSHQCFQKVPVDDQGQCGSCYANAVGGMIGIRRCLADQGGAPKTRRLAEVETPEPSYNKTVARQLQSITSKSGCTCKTAWKTNGFTCTTSCCNPDNSPGPWCFTTDTCNGVNWDDCPTPAPPPPPPTPASSKPITTQNGCTCKSTWRTAGFTCTSSCCNPDNAKGPWCFTTATCKGVNWDYCPTPAPPPAPTTATTRAPPPAPPTATTRAPPPAPPTTSTRAPPSPAAPSAATCTDNAAWKSKSGTCSSWTPEDCNKYKDVGQLANCRKTCGTCSVYNADGTKIDPWTGAWYKYIPSINDLATCARDTKGNIKGCDGGNVPSIWNNWMRSSGRSIYSPDSTCMPFSLKCFTTEPGSVVNPNSAGECNSYANFPLFRKPCSCISSNQIPSTLPQCSSAAPKSSCSVPAAVAMFSVKTVSEGLSIADAVLNIQRHILEAGPIYMSFDTTNEFMKWDWKNKPVYTGGSKVRGGHAVIGIGWGKVQGTDFWLLRNSWGDDYADGGHFRFQRGINLDQIEADGSAAMPVAGFADFSPPVCDLQKWARSYTTDSTGVVIKKLTMTLTLQCNKKASLTTWVSYYLASRDFSTASGETFPVIAATGDVPFTVNVDLIQHKFGLKDGTMWVNLEAVDKGGNKATIDRYITVAALPGATKYG